MPNAKRGGFCAGRKQKNTIDSLLRKFYRPVEKLANSLRENGSWGNVPYNWHVFSFLCSSGFVGTFNGHGLVPCLFIGIKTKKPGGFYGNNIVHDYHRSRKRSEGVLWNLSVLECGDSQNQVQRQSSAHDRSGSAWKQLWCGLRAASGPFELAELQQRLPEMEEMGGSGLKKENSGKRWLNRSRSLCPGKICGRVC